MDTNAVRNNNENDGKQFDISVPSTSSNCTYVTAIDELNNATPKSVNNNIDLNELMLDDSNESFDFNKIKSESYNFLDESEYGRHNQMMINAVTDSYDVNDIINSSPPPLIITTVDNNVTDPSNHTNNEMQTPQTQHENLPTLLTDSLIDNTNTEENSDKYQYVFIPQMSDEENEFSDEEMEDVDRNEIQAAISLHLADDIDLTDNSQQQSQVILESIESDHNYSTKQKSSNDSCMDDFSSGDETIPFLEHNLRNMEGIAHTSSAIINFDIINSKAVANENIESSSLSLPLSSTNEVDNNSKDIADDENINSNTADSNVAVSNVAILNDNSNPIDITEENNILSNIASLSAAVLNKEIVDPNDVEPCDNIEKSNDSALLSNNSQTEINDNVTVNQFVQVQQPPGTEAENGNDLNEDEPSDVFSDVHSEPMEHRYRLRGDDESTSLYTLSDVNYQSINQENENADNHLDESFNSEYENINQENENTDNHLDESFNSEHENIDNISNNLITDNAPAVLEPQSLKVNLSTEHNTVEPIENLIQQNEALIDQSTVIPELHDNPSQSNSIKNDKIDPKLIENLLKFEQFSENIKKHKEKLLTSISADNAEIDKNCDEFASTLERDFKELLKEFRSITCQKNLATTSAKNDNKSAEDRALNAIKLNQESKEQWLASTSSSSERNDSDDGDSQQSKIGKIRRRVKKRRILESTQSTEDTIQGISKNTKRRIGSNSESDDESDDSGKTKNCHDNNQNSPSEIKDHLDQEESSNKQIDDVNLTDDNRMEVDDELQSIHVNDCVASDIDDGTHNSPTPSQKSIDYSQQSPVNKDEHDESNDEATLQNQSTNIQEINKITENDVHDTSENEQESNTELNINSETGENLLFEEPVINKETSDESIIFKEPILNDERPHKSNHDELNSQIDETNSVASYSQTTASSIDELDLGEFLLSSKASSMESEDIIERQPQLHELLFTPPEMPTDENLTQIMVKNEPMKECSSVTENKDDENESENGVEIVENPQENNDETDHIMYDDFESDFEGFGQNRMSFEAEIKMESNEIKQLSTNVDQQQSANDESQVADLNQETTCNDKSDTEETLENELGTTNELPIVDDVKVEDIVVDVNVNELKPTISDEFENDLPMVDDSEVDDVQADDDHVDDVQADDVQLDDAQVNDSEVDEAHVDDVQIEDAQVNDDEVDDVKVEDVVANVDVNELKQTLANEDVCMDSDALAAIEDFAHINTEDMIAEFKSYDDNDQEEFAKNNIAANSTDNNDDNDEIVATNTIEKNDEMDENQITEKTDEKNIPEAEQENLAEINEDENIENITVTPDISLVNDNEDNVENDSFDDNEDDEENEDIDDLRDKEIDKLLDFTTLDAKKKQSDVYYVSKNPTKPKPKKVAPLIDILNEPETNETIESNSESEEEIITEQQYLEQCNVNMKEKLLAMTPSDASDMSDDSQDSFVETNADTNAYSISDDDDSNDSLMNKFLKSKIKNEIQDSFVKNEDKPEDTKLDQEEGRDKSVENDDGTDISKATVENSVDEPMPNEVEEEEALNLEKRSSTKSTPRKRSLEDTDTDDNKSDKATTSKRDKMDAMIFSKNLFNNLSDDEVDKKIDDADGSDSEKSSIDSDCEILDVSMFKSNKKGKEIDDARISKALANAKKPTVSRSNTNTDCISLSSDSDLDLEEVSGAVEKDEEDNEESKSRVPRRMLRTDQLAGETKLAQREESDRIKRLDSKNERLTQILSQSQSQRTDDDPEEIVLDYDSKAKVSISVHPDIVKYLKKHQIDGVKFMYDTCYGSVDSIEKYPGSGCILAHCMGLGKTLQLIALLHTLIRYAQLKTNKILVICPKSTVMNWADEIQRWLGPVRSGPRIKVFHFPDSSDINDKLKILKDWHSSGKHGYPKAGCLLIGYEAFRTLVFYHLQKKRVMQVPPARLESIKKKIEETLLKPGADLVICDEGHMIKNRKSGTSLAVNEIKTKRRIILTGTPIQNNLKEYYSMVNFIKPSFLGTEKEFANLYANPIKSGQHKDSSKSEIKFMKQRSFVLHKKLSKFVQRREAALLKTFLPDKYEYVLFIPMTEVQNRLYEYFLANNPLKEKYGGKSLIPDYTFLRKIWTHPKVLEIAWENAVNLQRKKDLNKPKRSADSEDDQPDDVLDSQVGQMSVINDWWREYILPEDLATLLTSNKLRILFEILKLCAENNEKCLIFSAFVAVLNVVEHFMQEIHKQGPLAQQYGFNKFQGPWVMGQDYYRLDGKTPKSIRHTMITKFNNPSNTRTRCFLISAKAGGQGINLIGANRVILLDTSWNPSNDQQNIFRVFRLGQKSKCYIYRLLAMGTMEEKVYSRSVTKQAMSFRVVDEQQIDRHYSMAELAELYTLTKPDYKERPIPMRPNDNILASLLHNFPDLVYKYHEHDSLLEQNTEQGLSDEEKKEAWASYEKDVSMKNQFNNQMGAPVMGDSGMYMPPYGSSIGLPGYNNASMLNAYNSAAYNAYMNQMTSYPPGIDKDLMMISQMYNNSPYSSILGSSGNNSRNLSLTNLNSMFGQSLYNTASSVLPNSTSPTTSSYAAAILSSVAAASSPFGGVTTTTPSYTNMLSNLFTSFPNSVLSSSASSTSGNTSTTTTTAANRSTLQNQTHPENLSRTLDKDMMSYLANASNLAMNPGPNALKNPMLSKELNMPSLVPVQQSTKDPTFNLPSIPTSVITKTSALPTNLSTTNNRRASPSISPLGNLISNAHHRTSPSLHRTSPGAISNTSPHHRLSPSITNTNIHRTNTITVGSRSTTNVMPSTSTSSVANRSSPAVNLIQSNRSTPTAASISLGGGENRLSPEPHIIVKNVNAINQSVESSSSKSSANKQPIGPIKNINIGIVYPPKKDTSTFDLTHNNSILETAKKQLNALGSRGMTVTSSNVNSTPQLSNLSNRQQMSGVNVSGSSSSSNNNNNTVGHQQRPNQMSIGNKRSLPVNRGNITNNSSISGNSNNNLTRMPLPSPAHSTPGSTTTFVHRTNDSTTIISKPNQLAKNVVSDITLSQTGKTLSQQGVSISAVPQVKKVNNSFNRPSNTTPTKVSMTPQQIKQQQLLAAAKRNYPSKNTMPTLQLSGKSPQTAIVGKSPSSSISSASTVKRLPTTSVGGMVRQNSSPLITGNTSIAAAQAKKIVAGAGVTPKNQPTLIRQNTVPNLKSTVASTVTQSTVRGQLSKQNINVRTTPSVSSRLTNPTANTTKNLSTQRITTNTVNGENVIARVSTRPQTSGSQLQSNPIRLSDQKRVINVKPSSTSLSSGGRIVRPGLQPGTTNLPSSSSASNPQQLSRKRKIAELLPSNSSISITEVKRAKLTGTSLNPMAAKKQPPPATQQGQGIIRQSLKKISSFDGVTIVPRNTSQSNNSNQSQRFTQGDSLAEIVELD